MEWSVIVMMVEGSAFTELITKIKEQFDEVKVDSTVKMFGHIDTSTVNTRRITLNKIDDESSFTIFIFNLTQNVPVIALYVTKGSTIGLSTTSNAYTYLYYDFTNQKWVPAEAELHLTMALVLLGYGVYEFQPVGGTGSNAYYYEVVSDIDTDTWQAGSDYSVFNTSGVAFDYMILQ